ncbi:GNAT family N-acetyltransferase [Musicola paradisiaca]|uniref:GCN5-related N-acetyltransferase n=1 Tax=Musicola paradisiaca (strain Ech703) TaxID=579405 RepID=C6C494_MUSP7|nr:GNAT family N-acetyltransferase [Musicola paradisiaca]ACS85468.1 GCN5-related N-acetyltransferase [Musicola paradisiaca Ech703]
MLVLTECTGNDIGAYRNIFVEEYRNDLIKNHHLEQSEAHKKAIDTFNSSFSDNHPEQNNSLLRITKDLKGEPCHVGYIWLLYSPREQSVFIMDFYISQEYRNKKIGYESMCYLISMLECSNVTTIKLRVEPDNQMAIGLYKKAGFDITGINMVHKITPKVGENEISNS